MRTRDTAAQLKRIRYRAVKAVNAGYSPTLVAQLLGVHRVTVHRWLRMARIPGGLDAKPIGHPPRLTDEQLPRLQELLQKGALAHGWPDDIWTPSRVAVLISATFGIQYHPEHVRKLLKQRLGWQGADGRQPTVRDPSALLTSYPSGKRPGQQ